MMLSQRAPAMILVRAAIPITCPCALVIALIEAAKVPLVMRSSSIMHILSPCSSCSGIVNATLQ